MIKLKNLLTEAFTDNNGFVWPFIKDQKSVTTLNNIGLYGITNNPNVNEILFGKPMTQNAQARLGTADIAEFNWIFWHIQALTPTRTAFVIPSDMATVMRTIFNSNGYAKTENYVRFIGSSYSAIDVKNALLNPDNIKWWDTLIEYPKGTKNLTRWQLFSQTYLRPNLSKLQPLVVAPAAPIAAKPSMAPGVKTAPGKQ